MTTSLPTLATSGPSAHGDSYSWPAVGDQRCAEPVNIAPDSPASLMFRVQSPEEGIRLSPIASAAPIDPRRWRRGLAKASRRPVRAIVRYRPSPIVGALVLGAIIGGGVTAAAGNAFGDHSAGHPAVISQSLNGPSGNGVDGRVDHWDRFGDHRGMQWTPGRNADGNG